MNIVVCVDEKNGIGKDGKLLYSIPDDMKHFREVTKDSIVVMGRKTLYSFKDKAPLKNRINIVFTKEKDKLEKEYKNNGYENIYFIDNINDIDEIIKKYEYSLVDVYKIKKDGKSEKKKIYVIGGESIYKMFIDKCDTLYITKIFKTFEADTFFLNYDNMGYIVKEKSDIMNYNDVKYQFLVYSRM